ncbi:hypothetical protein [Polaribacter sp.]|uniref:hypothetical protein n=1 Tax=Polaribacter sp. TaxID=1920175 RepID=UPI003F6CE7E8
MKKFVFKLILFLSPLLIFTVLLEVLLKNIPNVYIYKKEYLDKNAINIETLILGSSHSYGGLNPELFSSKTFNAAHSGQLFYYDNKIFNKYKDRFKSLKNIILPISYASFFGNYQIKEISHYKKNYNYYFGLGTTQSIEVIENNPKENLKKIVGYYYNNNYVTKLGWAKIFNSKESRDLIKSAHETLKWHTPDNIKSKKNQTIFKENLSTLKSILNWCRINNVNVILYTLPAYKTYRNNLNKEQLSITILAAQKIAEEYKNCIYLNLIADNNYIEKDFWDSSHLSEYGAEKLSRFMDSIIEFDVISQQRKTLNNLSQKPNN